MYETPIVRASTCVGHVEIHDFYDSYRVDFFRNDRPSQAYRCAWVPSFKDALNFIKPYEVQR